MAFHVLPSDLVKIQFLAETALFALDPIAFEERSGVRQGAPGSWEKLTAADAFTDATVRCQTEHGTKTPVRGVCSYDKTVPPLSPLNVRNSAHRIRSIM